MPEKPEKRMRTVCSCVGIPEACRPSQPAATCACSLPPSPLPPRMFDFSICWPSEEGKKKSRIKERERRCNCCWPKVNDVNEAASTAAAPRCLPLSSSACCCSYCNHSSYTARPAPLHCRQRLPHTSRVVVRRVHILTPF